MASKGISLSLTYVVVGLILLSTAVSVLIYFQGGIDNLDRVVTGETDESGDELARNSCQVDMRELCRQEDIQGNDWAEEAEYRGQTCSEYWDSEEAIPKCPE